MKNNVSPMQIAGIFCGITLAIIAYFIFSTPSNEFVEQLAYIGAFFGGGATYGILILAALPPLVGFSCALVWKWFTK
ncbi:hypothetical protein V5G99_02455 [Bibersteinia trehalosi]|uniref:hypothetical protein n=1 Tax=Bibersteinia trehalosi TaxID=47735 RepID=UPI001044FD10|nr:hypothetical protein [Bibersteinia trehalosi]TCT14156.1 hypothetical protein EDC51_10944 [Bibersteinia trehalosi]